MGDQFWTIPEWEGIYLSFQFSDSINVDCLFAGHIQYRLHVARTVHDDLADWSIFPRWMRKQLILKLSDEVVAGFDSSALAFSDNELDSLLEVYPVEEIEIKNWSFGNYASIHFHADYNIPELAKVFHASESTIFAEPNGTMSIWPMATIDLFIEEDTYRFLFIGGWERNGNWEIRVVDDQARVISRPTLTTVDMEDPKYRSGAVGVIGRD
ncbi:hypothetical protein ACFL5M_05560 [Candidatus Neomarinimicrobiota bacterium]